MDKDYREEFWKGLKELEEKLKELIESQRKTDEQMKETDKKLKELMESQKRTDEQLKETDSKLKELMERQSKTDEQIKETDRQIKALTKAISDLNGTWKKFSEKIVFDNIEETLKDLGFKKFIISRNLQRVHNSQHMEVDILAVGEDYVLVMEVKTTLRVEHVRKFIKKLKEKFLTFFPEFKGRYKVYGVVIGINFQEGVDEFAIKNGLLVLKYKDKGKVEVLNPKGFRPKDFSGV